MAQNESLYGQYHSTSKIGQSIKDVMRESPNWVHLSDPQAESLEQIATRISRILVGDKDYRNHWDELAEFALLAGEVSPANLPTITKDIVEGIASDIKKDQDKKMLPKAVTLAV